VGHLARDRQVVIHADRPEVERPGCVHRLEVVPRPDGARKPVADLVGLLERLVLRVERQGNRTAEQSRSRLGTSWSTSPARSSTSTSAPGLGSTFKLHLPRVDAPGTAEPPEVGATPAVGTGTVLVVEDEPVVRDMTTQMLTRSGNPVIAVADGAEAVAQLARLDEPIDVLVSDVIMPHMSGIELAELVMARGVSCDSRLASTGR
jgi:hypothetical protein